jgi:hypothetical protein
VVKAEGEGISHLAACLAGFEEKCLVAAVVHLLRIQRGHLLLSFHIKNFPGQTPLCLDLSLGYYGALR